MRDSDNDNDDASLCHGLEDDEFKRSSLFRPKRSRNFKGQKHTTRNERLNVIYDYKVHQLSVLQIKEKYNLNYNTIRNILQAYFDSGRICAKKYIRVNVPKLDKKRPPMKTNIEREMFLQEGPVTLSKQEYVTTAPLMLFYGEEPG